MQYIFLIYIEQLMLDINSEMQVLSRKNSQLVIPEASEMRMNIILEQLKYQNNNKYSMKSIKSFRPYSHFKILNESDIYLIQQSSEKIIYLFILFFCVNTYENQNFKTLDKFKEYVYQNDIIVPKQYPVDYIFWEQNQTNTAIKTIFAKLFTEKSQKHLISWIEIFEKYDTILFLYEAIFRNILTQISKTDKYLNQGQIMIQDLQKLGQYFNFDIYKTKSIHFSQSMKGIQYLTNKQQEKTKSSSSIGTALKLRLQHVQIVENEYNRCFCLW